MARSKPLALIAEDEPQMTMIIEYILAARGFECVSSRDGVAALELFRETEPDVVLLDVTMPRMGGLEVCRRIRSVSEVPILLVTAHGEADDILAGFEAGADDYVSKPFDPRVLGTRVDNAMRRGAHAPKARVEMGELVIDTAARAVRVGGAVASLSVVEWRVLAALADRADDVVSWRSLLAQAWETEEWVGGRELVKATVYRLRQRLGAEAARHIETVRGEGYRLRSNPEERYR
jgi:DNA-binding response OmpR family regulator